MPEYETHRDRRVALGGKPFDPYEPFVPTAVHEPHKGRYTRGYLPHIDLPLTHFITFRLHDSFPARLLDQGKAELDAMEEDDRRRESCRRTEAYVDEGHGSCRLRDPKVAKIVEEQLHDHDGARYDLLAWTLMPNHVHLLISLREGFSLPKVVQSWKARSARKANERLGRYRDYYDRCIRDEIHFANCLRYIDQNPVEAKLCEEPAEWAWGSARLGALGRERAPSATRRSQETSP